jgi:hypothetical protein
MPKGRYLLPAKAKPSVDCMGHPKFYILVNSICGYVCIVGTCHTSASYSVITWRGEIPLQTATVSVLVVHGNKKAEKNRKLQEFPIRNLGQVITKKKPWNFTSIWLVFASSGFNTKNSAMCPESMLTYLFFMILTINRNYWSTTKQHCKRRTSLRKTELTQGAPENLNHHGY